MSVKPLTEHHLEFLSLKGCCTGSSESTLVKMSHCWKSHITAHLWEIPFDYKGLILETSLPSNVNAYFKLGETWKAIECLFVPR